MNGFGVNEELVSRSQEARVGDRARPWPFRRKTAPIWLVLRTIWVPLVGAAVIFGVWYLVIALFDIEPLLLPPPHSVFAKFWEYRGTLLSHGWTTTVETVAGLGASVFVGAILAVLLAEISIFSRAFMPWIVVSQAIPKVAVAPLFVIWFGFALLPKVIIAFFIAFFPIVVAGVIGLKSIGPEEIDLFRTMTRSRWHLYRHLKIPGALPMFFGGVKVGASLALVGAIVGEFVSSSKGLGYLVVIANRDLQTEEMFAVFVALSLLGILLFYGIALIERLTIPWYSASKEGAREYKE